jgi:hypothetical protein
MIWLSSVADRLNSFTALQRFLYESHSTRDSSVDCSRMCVASWISVSTAEPSGRSTAERVLDAVARPLRVSATRYRWGDASSLRRLHVDAGR